MSGSRFHPYALEEGTNSDKSRNPPGRYISATTSTSATSHQATSSQKVLSHSTSSTIKNIRPKNGNTKSVPLNKAAPTSSASRQTGFTPLATSQAVITPMSSSQAASTPVASRSAASIPVASQPGASIPAALRRGTSAPRTTHKVSSTPLGTSQAASTPKSVGSGLAAYPYWSMAQNLLAMEQQQRIHFQQQWRQQLWMQQPNMVYMAGASQEYLRSVSQEYLRGTSQEYLRYMNELRHMSVLPLIPTSPAILSYLSPMQDKPLNLSLKDNVKDSTPISVSSIDVSSKPVGSIDCLSPDKPNCSKQASPKSSSPPSLKLHPTKPIQVGSLDPEVAKMFPHLRTTDTGSIVLWNFLWALLADSKYKGIISWIDCPSLKFQVVHPLALAKLWGTVKKNKTMNWQKLMKVINLYLSKNILKQGEDKLMFQFILVPQSPEVETEKDSLA